MNEEALIVDVHCHMFNAADIPVRGFVRHVALKDRPLSSQLAAIAARLTSGAPGHAADLERIDGLLAGGTESARPSVVEERLREQVAEGLLDLSTQERQEIAAELDDGEAGGTLDGPELATPGAVVRFVAWAKLFSQSRADLAVLYAKHFTPAASLAIPMLVDLAGGVGGDAVTGLDEQVELFGRLSEVSMHGLLPGAADLRLHPFVSLDPFRLINGHEAADGRSVRDLIEDAVMRHGFVGVKVYPEMGWRPSGNTAANAGSVQRARRLDQALDEFFGWCAEHSVPITAHCNHSNFAHDAAEEAGYGAPAEWLPVLRDHPRLRVNLGHFGGAHDDERRYSWAWDIARGMSEFPDRLFGDVGCHPVHDEALMGVHMGVLRQMTDAHPEVARQVMFGTDWYMVAVAPRAEDFTTTYQRLFRNEFGDHRVLDFLGRNALRFLGFADPADRSGARLRRRYAELGAARPDWLPASEGGDDS